MRVVLGIAFLPIASWLCWQAQDLFSGRGSGVLYLGWFSVLTLFGFLSTFVCRSTVVWGALLITWSQSLFVYWRLDAAGEIEHPSRSTGGGVEWVIVTAFLFLFSPVPAAVSWLGWRWSRKPGREVHPGVDPRAP